MQPPTYMNKCHCKQDIAKSKFAYVNKWVCNEQINQNLSKHFWKASRISNAQITQTLKSDPICPIHGKPPKEHLLDTNISNPNYTLFTNHEIDMWPNLLSTCTHPHIKGLCTTRHNKIVHQIALTLQSNKHTRCYRLVNVGNPHNQPQDTTILEWLIQCTCLPNTCTCMARLKPDILCILGAPIDSHTPIPQTQ